VVLYYFLVIIPLFFLFFFSQNEYFKINIDHGTNIYKRLFFSSKTGMSGNKINIY